MAAFLPVVHATDDTVTVLDSLTNAGDRASLEGLTDSSPVRCDARGWFDENRQRAAMIATCLPDFGPVGAAMRRGPLEIAHR